jgi:adenylate kinase
MTDRCKPQAVLLLGPTGSGKTPLGDLLGREGLWGRPCRHFDFGDHLRGVVAGSLSVDGLSERDVRFLASVLHRGALLEDEQFPIAEKILRAFIERAALGDDELIVLNGLPRHVGQAEAVDAIVAVRAVIELTCPADVVIQRIRSDAGGDRGGRADDDRRLIDEKLATYAARTAPLVTHYRDLGAALRRAAIGPETTSEQARDMLNRID